MSIFDRQLRGEKARKAGGHFEDKIGESLDAYAEAAIAYLDFMPLPMTPCGQRHPLTKAPMYIPKGKAPFDVYGHKPTHLERLGQVAVFVGAECKSSSERETSLPIVKPLQHGKGLAYHQLDALALVAKLGGVARVIWDNAGEVGILDEAKIIHHHLVYSQSLAAEEGGRKPVMGSRSIPWASFQVVDYGFVGGKLVIDWLRAGVSLN